MLRVEGITKHFGGLTALESVNIHAEAGSVFGVIGPNGAGKSTLTNVCTGLYRPDAGTVRLDGEDITGRHPAEISRRGIARTFQHVRLFDDATVLDNVLVAAEVRRGLGLIPSLLRTRHVRRESAAAVHDALAALEFVGLSARADDFAGDLPAGSQRQLEVARALATDPKVLFLDEPAAGLSSGEQARLAGCIRRAADSGRAVVLIEHNMPVVMELCDWIFVLNFGIKIAEGDASQIVNDHAVIEAYLGVDDEED